MNRDVQVAWEAALRSGSYAQGRNALCVLRTTDDLPPLFCCLGVLCELAADADVVVRVERPGVDDLRRYRAPNASDEPGSVYYNYLPPAVQTWAGLASHDPRSTDGRGNLMFSSREYEPTFADLNDEGRSFADIADLVAAL
jgi:hypothetical protein